jgi:hypothetical protein
MRDLGCDVFVTVMTPPTQVSTSHHCGRRPPRNTRRQLDEVRVLVESIETPLRACRAGEAFPRAKRCDGSDTDAMSDLWDEADHADVSPICPTCGVSALPPELPGEPSSCENSDCSEFGEPMGS